jgi:hypothetical protein
LFQKVFYEARAPYRLSADKSRATTGATVPTANAAKKIVISSIRFFLLAGGKSGVCFLPTARVAMGSGVVTPGEGCGFQGWQEIAPRNLF